MSLDVSFGPHNFNITHNLQQMANAAGIYYPLWEPTTVGITTAGQLSEKLKIGLALLKSSPEYFKQFDSPNKWGTYDGFLLYIEELIQATDECPDELISIRK